MWTKIHILIRKKKEIKVHNKSNMKTKLSDVLLSLKRWFKRSRVKTKNGLPNKYDGFFDERMLEMRKEGTFGNYNMRVP